jgi:hypothetical protein
VKNLKTIGGKYFSSYISGRNDTDIRNFYSKIQKTLFAEKNFSFDFNKNSK